MGGVIPLGYKREDKKLLIEPAEAEIVRYIFTRFLERDEKEPLRNLLEELKSKGYRNKSYVSQTGNSIVGKDFNLNQIAQILRNPIYVGKIRHKDKIYDGEHEAIISQDIWDNIQARLKKTSFVKSLVAHSERPKLAGKIYDYHGNKLYPTYSYKYSKNGRYKMRYYINREIKKMGKTSSEFKRIRADYLDQTVETEVYKIIDNKISEITNSKNLELISANLKTLRNAKDNPMDVISKAILFPDHIELHLNLDGDAKISIPLQYKRFGIKLCITNTREELSDIEKNYCHPDDKTFAFVAKGFYWRKLLQDSTYMTIDQISKAQNHSKPYIKRALRQRYLAPDIINKILNPKSEQINIERLISSIWCWEEQKILAPQ